MSSRSLAPPQAPPPAVDDDATKDAFRQENPLSVMPERAVAEICDKGL